MNNKYFLLYFFTLFSIMNIINTSEQAQELSSKKRKKDSLLGQPSSSTHRTAKGIHFDIPCKFCPNRKILSTANRSDVIKSFNSHMKAKHPTINPHEISKYIRDNLQEPSGTIVYSIRCPECAKAKITSRLPNVDTFTFDDLSSFRLADLKRSLCRHILESRNHSVKNNYTKEAIREYVEENYFINIIMPPQD